jgi:hypothetical protein
MDGCEKCEPEEYSTGIKCIACADATECPCLDGDKCYSESYCYNTGIYLAFKQYWTQIYHKFEK